MLKNRFRKYLPVVVDIETGGFDPAKNAILEIAITLIEYKDNIYVPGETFRHHIEPFEGSSLLNSSKEGVSGLNCLLLTSSTYVEQPLKNNIEAIIIDFFILTSN